MPKYTFQTLCKLFSLFVLIAVSGCAGTPDRFYIPKAQPIPAKEFLNPDFTVHRYVNLVNNQANDDDIFIGAYTHDWWANYQRWTDAAIEMLQTELKNRGKVVNVNALTVFSLAICKNAAGLATGTLHTDLKKIGCPLDTDQDGIPDGNDQCPGTPEGIDVDQRGCPLDTDGDGVPDYKDQCAGEPKERDGITPTQGGKEQQAEDLQHKTEKTDSAAGKSDCKTTFSIAGQDPPDTVIQLIKSELGKENIVLSEIRPNIFTFSTTATKWDEAHWKLQEGLENRGLLMLDGPPQILKLAIYHVELFWNFHDVGCTLNLQVQTLQEQVRNFTATNISPELYVSCDWALSKAVAQMFVDQAILKDTDGDGVPDHTDECPDTPEDVKVDKRGCPLDTDGDGVPDYMDECPDTPKGVVVDVRGCPLDTDGDGVPDYRDECPATPKGAEVDEHGCPLDTDGDGVPDYRDECPGTPKGARVDERGCWVISEALFDFNKYQIKTAFYPHLDEIITVLQENPAMAIEIQGHTDNVGSSQYNKRLSENRAKAVKNYLTNKGIKNQRLIAVGFGSSRPKTDNTTETGRALNRRVELLPVQ